MSGRIDSRISLRLKGEPEGTSSGFHVDIFRFDIDEAGFERRRLIAFADVDCRHADGTQVRTSLEAESLAIRIRDLAVRYYADKESNR